MKNIIIIPLLLGGAGYLFSTHTWLKFINTLSPIAGLAIYYLVVMVILIILMYVGIRVGNISFTTYRQIIGSTLIIFSFFILFDFSSCYQNEIIHGNCNIPINFIQMEDGVVYNFWNKFTPNISKLRILTYVVTPFILTFLGIYLITDRVELS